MLKLIQTDWGKFDLALDDGSDPDAAVATLIYAALFTDAPAPDNRISDRFERRGYWADQNAGTGLWHVRRQALTDAARTEAIMMVRGALLKHTPALSDITVTEVTPDHPAGNVSSLTLEVAGFHNGRKFIVKATL